MCLPNRSTNKEEEEKDTSVCVPAVINLIADDDDDDNEKERVSIITPSLINPNLKLDPNLIEKTFNVFIFVILILKIKTNL